VIIDGRFDQELAVWHKEVLWALAHGIRVYGAASMGALRAAELAAFGMVGVGPIFEDYRQGVLEDDDEVAVAHEGSEGGFRPLSEAMVDIRATLLRAEAEGVIGAPTRERLISAGKALFYPQRSLAAVLAAEPDPTRETLQLRRWLRESPTAPVAQKRQDAEAVLRRVVADAATFDAGRPTATFDFAYTEAWHEFRRRADASSPLK
jgi:hypothetical protein